MRLIRVHAVNARTSGESLGTVPGWRRHLVPAARIELGHPDHGTSKPLMGTYGSWKSVSPIPRTKFEAIRPPSANCSAVEDLGFNHILAYDTCLERFTLIELQL